MCEWVGKKGEHVSDAFPVKKKKKKIAAVTQNPAFCGLAALRKKQVSLFVL